MHLDCLSKLIHIKSIYKSIKYTDAPQPWQIDALIVPFVEQGLKLV